MVRKSRKDRESMAAFLRQQVAEGQTEFAQNAITTALGARRSTVNRHLARMTAEQVIVKRHAGPATRYSLPVAPPPRALAGAGFQFSPDRRLLLEELAAPIGTRKPVSYRRAFVERYASNVSSLLAPALAETLFQQGRVRGRQPAGTYARKVLEQLLIDFAWHSSRLEGNSKSLLETRALFQRGRSPGDDEDALMLLNHKDAIEFLVEEVPHHGMKEVVIRNIQSGLMQVLLKDTDALGATRRTVVTISDSFYVPLQVPRVLDEMLALIVDKACQIRNPVEAAFFL